jgi:alpha-1,3-glucan synthase
LVTDEAWLIFSNLDYEWKSVCNEGNEILSSFPSGTSLKNIFPPYETIVVGQGSQSTCVGGIVLPPFGFKAFVKAQEWLQPSPTLLSFSPGIIISTNMQGTTPEFCDQQQ